MKTTYCMITAIGYFGKSVKASMATVKRSVSGCQRLMGVKG